MSNASRRVIDVEKLKKAPTVLEETQIIEQVLPTNEDPPIIVEDIVDEQQQQQQPVEPEAPEQDAQSQ